VKINIWKVTAMVALPLVLAMEKNQHQGLASPQDQLKQSS
jgi:hypothetical protein